MINIKTITGIIVAIIVTVTVAIPIISDVIQPEKLEGDNEPDDGRYSVVQECTISITNRVAYLNGEQMDSNRCYVVSKFLFFDGSSIVYFDGRSMHSDTNNEIKNAEFTITPERMTGTYGSISINASNPGDIIVSDSDGSYGCFMDNGFYFDDSDNLYFTEFQTYVSDDGALYFYKWNVNDGVIYGSKNGNNDAGNNLNFSYEYNPDLNAYYGEWSIDTIPSSALPVGVFAPVEYEFAGETPTEYEMIAIIPLIFITGLIIAVVSSVITLKSRGGGA